MLLIIGTAILVAVLPIILKIASLTALYHATALVAQLILAILIMLLVMPPHPHPFFNLLRKIVSSVTTTISNFFSTPYIPPRLSRSV